MMQRNNVQQFSNRLGLGTAQFGLDYGVTNKSGRVSEEEVGRILNVARGCGVTLLDTAASYGSSEQVLGVAGIEGFKVITKLPPLEGGEDISSSWVLKQIAGSLSRLKTRCLYAVLVHNLADLRSASGSEIVSGLLQARKSGLVEKIGVSIYDPSDLDWVFQIMEPDLIQAPLNVFDQRLALSGWLETLKTRGVEVHVRSVFLQGTLLTRASNLPQAVEPWVDKYIAFEEWAASLQATPLEASLSFALSVPGVDRVLIGVSSVDELKHILLSRSVSLSQGPEFGDPEISHIDPRLWKN
jgi:aryl-alcohol dehydrogenase-like predicted oxidoreductase